MLKEALENKICILRTIEINRKFMNQSTKLILMKKKEVPLLKWLDSLVISVILKLKAHQSLIKPTTMIEKKKKYMKKIFKDDTCFQ